ncbi:formyltetrahydrofolate-dependent phosphoribosylglycinamide formyltransferase [Brevundimonas bullata]|uniref:Phosphoribosylglycinamide formyltransferase n=1 Tax=Brevundimonas bullata TaxID=13160 RepID=A0A7W7N3K5_9CAUL|nr:phosphoribosylglycinamide formyltransferase [Brevundimonas bullata]MBB4797342.1 formyltetrahydrofolate-dependent phosphoribosylglycinamide formyltransferase [Brevundimonas bullata]MBB6382301.1 formyltetrahydrofolate-dependent phosphoribosylglycinamide formyltransferase [Brevundimonas bullata]
MTDTCKPKTRVAVLISGSGTNMASLIAAGQAADAPYEVVVVISNVADVAGLEKARAAGVEALTVEHKPFGKDREAHERAINALLVERDVEVIALAGYMRLLTPWLVQKWAGRMLNIHPSLLPLYPGLNTHARAIEAGDAEAGCTVHVVTEGVDEGPVLGQARVPILPGDTPDALAERVKAAEHTLYPQALAAFVTHRRAA